MSAILTPQPRLGRLHVPDARDAKYALRRLGLLPATPRPPRTKIWRLYWRWLDQGDTGTCVEHGVAHLLMCTPVPRPPRALPPRFTLYDWAIAHDEFPANDRDTARVYGTSVRAGLEAARAFGLIANYGWAETTADEIDWVCYDGPLVVGTNYYSSMFERDAEGFVRTPRGRVTRAATATCAAAGIGGAGPGAASTPGGTSGTFGCRARMPNDYAARMARRPRRWKSRQR